MCLSPTGVGRACVFSRPKQVSLATPNRRSMCLWRIRGRCLWPTAAARPCVFSRAETAGPCVFRALCFSSPVSFGPCVFRALCLSVGVAVRMRLPPGCCPPRVASRCSSLPRSRGSVFRLRGVGRACVSGRREHVSLADRGRPALCLWPGRNRRTLCFSSLCLPVGVAVRMRLPPGCGPPRVASRCSSLPRSRGGVSCGCAGSAEHVSLADGSMCLWPTAAAGPCVFGRAGTAGPCVF